MDFLFKGSSSCALLRLKVLAGYQNEFFPVREFLCKFDANEKNNYLFCIRYPGFVFYPAFGQDTIKPDRETVQVLVTDFNNNSKSGEQILFEGLTSHEVYQGISNSEGKFEIQLNGNETYLIKVKSIGKAEEYGKFAIPELNKGEYYTPIQVTIQFEPPKTFTLDNVHFESGKSTLIKSSFEELEELLEFLKLKTDIVIEIGGHTDNVGEDESNLKLSEVRSATVKNYLVSKGVSSNRIESKGYGENQPIDTNSTPEGRQNNRRTEVRILHEK